MKRHDINTALFRSTGFDPMSGVPKPEEPRRLLPPLAGGARPRVQVFCAAAGPGAFIRGSTSGRCFRCVAVAVRSDTGEPNVWIGYRKHVDRPSRLVRAGCPSIFRIRSSFSHVIGCRAPFLLNYL